MELGAQAAAYATRPGQCHGVAESRGVTHAGHLLIREFMQATQDGKGRTADSGAGGAAAAGSLPASAGTLHGA
jgi:hypothetical protein